MLSLSSPVSGAAVVPRGSDLERLRTFSLQARNAPFEGCSRRLQADCRSNSKHALSRGLVSVRAESHNGSVPGLARTVWRQEEQDSPQYPKLASNETADVVVVGGGIAGLSIAYQLAKKSDLKVILLEGRTIASGQTGRTTAHLMMWNDDYYYVLEDEFGPARAKLVADSHRDSITEVEKIVKEEGIECKFQRKDGFLYDDDNSSKSNERLERELGATLRLGFETEMVDLGGGPEVGGIRRALKFPGSADFNPVEYCRGLAKAFVKHGGKLYEDTRVLKTEGNQVYTAGGNVVTTPNIVLATDSPIHENLLVHARQSPYRSYVTCLKIDPASVEKNEYWSTGTPYHYLRFEDHPTEGLVLVVGGGDHQTGMKGDEYKDDPWNDLELYARKRFPQAGPVAFTWSGQVMEPADQLGLYGQDPANNLQDEKLAKYWIATGDSGQGMTGGTIAGMVLSELIQGHEHPWKDLFSPSRVPPPNLIPAEHLAQEALTTIQSFADVVLPQGLLKSPDDLPAGEGTVMQQGTDKVAAYRDPSGQIHTFAAACPHLGCLVQWNKNEKSFDCPCHGSHFDPYGNVINGPAKNNLQPVRLTTFGTKDAGDPAQAR